MSLVQKIRKARESRVEVGGYTFIVLRPTALDMTEIAAASRGRAILPFIIGWEGVKELDIIPGGDPHPLEFDADVCTEWLCDRIDLLGPIATKAFELFVEYQAKLGAEKKS